MTDHTTTPAPELLKTEAVAPTPTKPKKESIWRKIEKFSDMGLVAGAGAAALAFEFLPIILPYCIGLAIASFVTGKIAGMVYRMGEIDDKGPLSTKEKLELLVDALSNLSSKTRLVKGLSNVFKSVASKGTKPTLPLGLDSVPKISM